MHARWKWLAALLLAFSLVAAACGDDGDDTSADTTTTAADDTGGDTTTTAADDTGGDTTTTAADDTGGDAGGDAVSIGEDGRLVAGACAEGTNNADDALGVTEDSVNVALVSIDFGPLADLGFAASNTDVAAMATPFIDAINDAGGVCGRTIDYQGISYDILAGEGGQACVQVTEDRHNVIVMGQGGWNEALCVADAGTITYTQQDFGEADIEGVSGDLGIIFSRSPSAEQAFGATAENYLPDLEGKKVGVWYGAIFPSQGDAVEEAVFPILDDAGIDYLSFRTDTVGPSDPEGAAILNTAATEFVGAGVDTVLGFTQTTNHVGMLQELDAQGLSPDYLWSNVGSNTVNDLFNETYQTQDIADGERVMTYTWAPDEAGELPEMITCNEQYQELGGDTFEQGTFDFQALGNVCHQIDFIVAMLTLVGPEITQEAVVSAIESLPRHPMGPVVGGEEFGPGDRWGVDMMAEQAYDGATNTYTTGEPFEIG